jgi:hypothetical protein
MNAACPLHCRCPSCLDFDRAFVLASWRGLLTKRATIEAAKLAREGIRPTAGNLELVLGDWLSTARPCPLPWRQLYPHDVDATIQYVAREVASES